MDYMDEDLGDECKHRIEVLVYVPAGNGIRHYAYQCRRCGRLSPWIRHADLSDEDLHCAEERDASIRQRYDAAIMQARLELLPDIQAERRRLEDQRRAEYSEYLDSDAWKAKRRRRRELNRRMFGGLCEICLERQATQCHHLTYERIYREWALDLACVCRRCHEEAHAMGREEAAA